MCGLIGVVTSDSEELEFPDLSSLAQKLESFPLSSSSIHHVVPELEIMHRTVQQLFEFSSVAELLKNNDRRTQLDQIHRAFEILTKGSEGQQVQAESTELQEKWAATSIAFKDLAWHLDQDLRPNLDKIHQLAGSNGIAGRTHAFALWQINTLLNGIDRLEVRGRDSAGIVVQLDFSEPAALERFASQPEVRARLSQRISQQDFIHGSVRTASASGGAPTSLIFAYKVALEIGEMGENVSRMRSAIAGDELIHRAMVFSGVRTQAIAHTRWASNGVISEPNCHPLDNESISEPGCTTVVRSHRILAALNGDIDNYQSLKEQLLESSQITIPSTITTDAKIIPLWIDRHLDQGCSLEVAFQRAIADFQGSMAIAVTSSLEPGKVFLALRGSGQSIYLGLTAGGVLFASELYGLVEETSQFIKMDGERERIAGDPSSAGQIAIIEPNRGSSSKPPTLRLMHIDGTPIPITEKLVRQAEITTRDINRAGYEHFMLKEITEAALSVSKTIRGKYLLDETSVRFSFADALLLPRLREALHSGTIRRIYCIGQGTASVAGQAIANLMTQLLADSLIEIHAVKATELSGFLLRNRMDDVLVVAVSQSGTTTDTNRTVDMVRERGAFVLAIVNRRNSDLVYKADAVLYTSDGRDVEMSVASTKAFYAQVAAGYLLSLALAQTCRTLSDAELREELKSLDQLPGLVGEVLKQSVHISALAESFAVRHRHWAVVGNGANKIAADEIRIKLSELCYKAIACDFTEDKKHIDLSSEPLILVCAAGLSGSNLQDVVKEVAIFKAHKATPLVITLEGESRFDPYMAGTLFVPRGAGRLSFLLATVAGHLWGYYAARALDQQARVLRHLRAGSVTLYDKLRADPGGISHDALTAAFRASLGDEVRQVETWLLSGMLDSGITAKRAARFALVLQAITGRIPYDDLVLEFESVDGANRSPLFESYLVSLTAVINDLTRPIDAIKHQAKTVTVGISRTVAISGTLFDAMGPLGLDSDNLLPSHVETLRALSPLIEEVTGSVRYGLDNLLTGGEIGPHTAIKVLRKTGIAATLKSRADQGGPLIGSKWLIALERRLFVGIGSTDGRALVMCPLFSQGKIQGILLLHVRFRESSTVAERLAAVKHYRNRFERLVGFITEHNQVWDDEYLLRVPIEFLFEGSPEQIRRVVTRSLPL